MTPGPTSTTARAGLGAPARLPTPPARLPTPPARHPASPARVGPEPLLRRLVGAAFRRRRAAQRRTLADVAGAARISIAYLSEIERGRKEPSSEVLVAVCRALGMRLADLLAEASAELRAADARALADVRTLTSRTERLPVLAEGPAHPAATPSRRAGDAYLSVA